MNLEKKSNLILENEIILQAIIPFLYILVFLMNRCKKNPQPNKKSEEQQNKYKKNKKKQQQQKQKKTKIQNKKPQKTNKKKTSTRIHNYITCLDF